MPLMLAWFATCPVVGIEAASACPSHEVQAVDTKLRKRFQLDEFVRVRWRHVGNR